MKKILWIEDDYYHIQALFFHIEKLGYMIRPALNALDGYYEAKKWRNYEAIVVDIILPLRVPNQKLPSPVDQWAKEAFPGIGLLKWLLTELKPRCPVLILSVWDDPIEKFHLEDLPIQEVIVKKALGPKQLFEIMRKYLDIE